MLWSLLEGLCVLAVGVMVWFQEFRVVGSLVACSLSEGLGFRVLGFLMLWSFLEGLGCFAFWYYGFSFSLVLQYPTFNFWGSYNVVVI